ncbi:uncharacterized protein RAG0_04686 [Rhynchosporium agropyri]|uniref:Nephrocystin 3-like N-terminal domain-containing protein n=1 Tax=Rhynchosporium agropyri TaxID=914238 RepID=A0A1E1K9T1_9HELO|nr:uncharacterized protein RAG0_04686 [Rhynchosporium agropyri]
MRMAYARSNSISTLPAYIYHQDTFMAAHSGSELDNDSDVEFFGCGKVFSDHADSWQGWDKSCSTTGNSLDSSIMPWGAIHQHVGRYAREKDSDIDRILILSSFEIVDYEKSMHKIPPAFVGTCSWIFSHPTFLAFNKAARGLLWIVGPIGHGKSVMAKLFVKKYTTIPLHYFFFDSNTTDGNTFLAVLKIIVKQLLARKPELTVHANASYHKLGAAFSEDLMELMTIFENCVKDARLGDTAILIDGLFECSDFQDEDFLCWITSTLGKAASVLRFIVTSRRFPTSRRNPSPILFRLHLDEDETAHDEICSDVQYYIKTTLNDSPITVQWTRSELTEFVTELTQHSNTFLWVNLFLEELWASKELSFVSACSLLKDTPDSLRAMYQRIFSKVTEGDQKSAKFLLQIIIAADYPLKIEDLNWLHAAYSSDGAAERFDINKRLNSDFQVYLRGLCGSVVPVVDGKASLQHRSVKDFVMEESDSAWYHFTEQEARVLLLQCCFWRLRSIKNNVRQVTPDQKFPPEGALTPPFSSSGKQPDEFFDYAIRHWAILFNQIQKYADEGLVGQIKSLYEDQEVFQRLRESESESCKKVSHIQLHEAVSKALTNQPVSGFGSTTVEIPRLHIDNSASRMYMASYLGHTRIFLAILDTNPLLIDITFDDGWTALCTAISSNQLDIVEAILTRKVDVERPSRGFRPLYHAATNLTSHISRVLLREGANVDALSYHQTTALHHAARNGRVEIVKALLDARANPNLIDGSGRTALHYAAGGGYCDIVDILLENLANPELLDNDSQTPLIVAVEKGRKNVVKSLLRTIPENIFMDCHKLILHAAMRCGNIEILHILVDAKSFELYFKVKDKYSLSAFAYITSTCDIAALKWSSERGADLDELDLQGTTLLQRMSMQDNVVGAKFLIEHGASTQMADSKGRTPLHYAAAGTGHEEMFLLLLKSGGDLEAKDHSGRTAFHDAVVHWRSQTTLRVLKSCGADIESGNLDGDTPLQTAVRMQNSGLVKWLVTDVKVNQDVVSNNGYTLHQLHRESFCQNMDATATGIYDQAEIYRFWCCPNWPRCVHWGDSQWSTTSSSVFRRPES